jgi:uncharacterized OB-fold protein
MAIDWPTRAAEVLNDEPLVIKNEKFWHHIHTYGGCGKFFTGLRQKKILATRCANPKCAEKRLWLPPRANCPDCWHDMQWVEAPQTGTIYTHSVVTYPGELFRLPPGTPLISVELDGVCTKLMGWLKEGQPAFGMKVKAVFNTTKPTNTILDLAWVPV